jgi:hypothetical protein
MGKCFFVQSFQGGYQGSAEVLYAAEGEGFQGVADYVFFQVKGAVVLRAADDEGQVDGEATHHFILTFRQFGLTFTG